MKWWSCRYEVGAGGLLPLLQEVDGYHHNLLRDPVFKLNTRFAGLTLALKDCGRWNCCVTCWRWSSAVALVMWRSSTYEKTRFLLRTTSSMKWSRHCIIQTSKSSKELNGTVTTVFGISSLRSLRSGGMSVPGLFFILAGHRYIHVEKTKYLVGELMDICQG